MRLSTVCLAVAAAFAYAPLTAGQPPPPSSLPPPARVGFQLGLRTGLAVPLGHASQGEEMSNVFAPQVPIIVEIGFEFAHFMGGVDFQLSRTFGLGPFAGLSIGQYRRINYENAVRNIAVGDISETAIHEWFMLGLRTVFFP
jgi:hypothetical protein